MIQTFFIHWTIHQELELTYLLLNPGFTKSDLVELVIVARHFRYLWLMNNHRWRPPFGLWLCSLTTIHGSHETEESRPMKLFSSCFKKVALSRTQSIHGTGRSIKWAPVQLPSILFTIWGEWPKVNQSWHSVSWRIVEETLHCHKMKLSTSWRNEPFLETLVFSNRNSLMWWNAHFASELWAILAWCGTLLSNFYTFCLMHGSSTNS
jgi:hypothetical protein